MSGFLSSWLKSLVPLGGRGAAAFACDVAMAAASFLLALYLRVGGDVARFETGLLVEATAIFAVIAAGVFLATRLYGGLWRYASIDDLLTVLRVVVVTIVLFVVAMFLVSRLEAVPRSTPFINLFVLLALLAGTRCCYRFLQDRRAGAIQAGHRPRLPVLLVGANDATELFVRAIHQSHRSSYYAVGIIDETGSRKGYVIKDVPILGGVAEMPQIVARLGALGQAPKRIVLTSPDTAGETVKALLELSRRLGIGVARMPRLDDFRSHPGAAADKLLPLNVEDLLRRPQAKLDRDNMAAMIAGRRILVTGAGGTVGVELSRQIASFGPAAVTLLDSSESLLYEIDLEIGEQAPDLPRRAVLADVRDRSRIAFAFREARPELVFHAAALKHVPMVEAQPADGVLTNVVGTRIVADACRAHGVAAMVLISTDKAVNPTSVMGATKRIAENYCRAMDQETGDGTRLVVVRFGNVLASTGSVVPLFERQIAAGGPLTVTHPEMARYFMTVREAVELVLHAAARSIREMPGAAAKRGVVHVLDMGEPLKIVDLARQMILLAGLRPDSDVKIEFIGPRPGERLAEELLYEAETRLPAEEPGIHRVWSRAADLALLSRTVDELEAAARAGSVADILDNLARAVPEYRTPGPREVAAG